MMSSLRIPAPTRPETTPSLLGTLGALALGFVSCEVAGLFLESPVFSVFGLLFFMLFLVRFAAWAPYTFALLLPYIAKRATMYPSGISIAFQGYMPEIATTGTPTLAMVHYTGFVILFMLGAAWVLEPLCRRYVPRLKEGLSLFNPQTHIWVPALFAVAGGLCLAMLAFGAAKGFPLLQNIDRFEFRSLNTDNYLFMAFILNRPLLTIFLGLVFAACQGARRQLALFSFIGIIFVSFLFGEKFTSIIDMLCSFLIPVFLLMADRNPWKKTRRLAGVFLGGSVVALLTIPVILYVYGWAELGADAALDRFQSRVSSQAQLWYVVDRDTQDLVRFDSEALTQDMKMIWENNSAETMQSKMTYPYGGMYNLMFTYMSDALLNGFFNQKIFLIMGFEAYLLKIYGWIGSMVATLFYAVLYALYLGYLAFGVATRNPFRILVAEKLLIFVDFALMQGDLWMFYGYANWRYIAMALVVEGGLRLYEKRQETLKARPAFPRRPH